MNANVTGMLLVCSLTVCALAQEAGIQDGKDRGAWDARCCVWHRRRRHPG